MAYSTSTDVIARSALLAGITDASTYIAIADADIDDALRDLYVVPFTTVPATIARLSADRAAGLKLRQTYRAGNKEAGLFADLLKDYEDGIAALQAGTLVLNATRAGSLTGGDAAAPALDANHDDGEAVATPSLQYGTDTTATTLDLY